MVWFVGTLKEWPRVGVARRQTRTEKTKNASGNPLWISFCIDFNTRGSSLYSMLLSNCNSIDTKGFFFKDGSVKCSLKLVYAVPRVLCPEIFPKGKRGNWCSYSSDVASPCLRRTMSRRIIALSFNIRPHSIPSLLLFSESFVLLSARFVFP